MTKVAILWHMHQPYYEDLVTREHILPWVRLHALKDYYGMVALLREFPAIRMTFNLVPSLLVQLEAFAGNRAHDPYLDLGLKPAAELTEPDVIFMLQNFFHAQRQRMIDTAHPRVCRAARAPGGCADAPRSARRTPGASASTTCAICRCGRSWPGWIRWTWTATAASGGWRPKGRSFTEDDKALLRTVELELLNAVIPACREAAARGQVELSTSPFYHPILPLLCDTDIYKRTHPESGDAPGAVRPSGGRPQSSLTSAVAYHERLFGRRPVGLWPSEGSVSDAMVPLAAQAGFEWMASDELILARTLGMTFSRDPDGRVEQPERLYRAYAIATGGARVAYVPGPRHVGPDRLSLRGRQAEAAAEDLVSRLVDAGRNTEHAPAGEKR